MNISKAVAIVTTGIPIVGILIGGIAFGLNFKTDVENIKEDVASQASINTKVDERFNAIPAAYDDVLVWNAINNIRIPDVYDDFELNTKSQNIAIRLTELRTEFDNLVIQVPDTYDDSHLNERVQNLALQATELRTELDNLDISIPDAYDDSDLSQQIHNLELQITELRTELDSLDIQDIEAFDDSSIRSRLAELEGQLNALASIDMNSDGSVDIGPLVVRIATTEGTLSTLQSSINSIKTDIRTIESDITAVERTANSAKSTADSARSSSGSSRPVENDYDDSNLRNRISTLERQVSALPTTSGGTTVQSVENPFDASSIRADIATLQAAISILQAAPDTSYNDSGLLNMIDNIQWELDNLNIPTDTGITDVSWLEEMIWSVKDDLSMRIDDLEWAAINTTSNANIYAEKWIVDDLQYEVLYVQEQLVDLQNVINSLETTSSSDTTSSNTTADDEVWLLYVDHQEDSYTGDYWLDGEYNGHQLWVNWDCGTSGSQFEYCYIFRYPVAFTISGWVWVIQPIPPSTEWSANAYVDARWPWKKTWDGDVNSVVKGD